MFLYGCIKGFPLVLTLEKKVGGVPLLCPYIFVVVFLCFAIRSFTFVGSKYLFQIFFRFFVVVVVVVVVVLVFFFFFLVA